MAPKKKGNKEKIEVKTEYYVFVNNAGKAEKRIVTIGVSDDSQQQILSGVKEGESVITGPYKILRYLKQGDRVTTDLPKGASEPAKLKA